MKEIALPPIKETTEDFEKMERLIISIWREEIYLPLMKELRAPARLLKNATDDILEAIASGRISFSRGRFTGKFTAATSRELKNMGAVWDRKSESFRLPMSELPVEVENAIRASESRFLQMAKRIDAKLAQILPDKIADRMKFEDLFDATLWRTDRDFKKSVKGIVVPPDLTTEQRARIAAEYTKNLQFYIQEWTEKEIVKLRKQVQENAFAGFRYENLIKTIQDSHRVSLNKAKFLARQETSLLMAKFKEIRYTDAGSTQYIWGCVAGSKAHPVRPYHKKLEGTKQSWNNPPIVNEKGERKHPGQDYNCRCFPRAIVKF